MLQIFLLSVVCASISFTVSDGVIFSSLRNYLSEWNKWIGKLVCCGYCFGHWVSFGLVILYKPRLFFSPIMIIDYFLTALFIAWLAGFQWLLMSFLMTKSGK